jgi:uncharacterized membrane protein
MSTTYITAIVIVFVQLLSFIGIDVGTEEVTSALTTIITVIGGLVIAYRRWMQNDITIAGVKK